MTQLMNKPLEDPRLFAVHKKFSTKK